jgi:hypothetical protein
MTSMGYLNLDLSEQALVDCDSTQNGCGGGWPFRILQSPYGYAIRYGVPTESSYPYRAVKQPCSSYPWQRYYNGNLYPYSEFNGGDENRLLAMLQRGPVMVAFYAAPSFSYYRSGIYYDGACMGKGVNHAGEFSQLIIP